MKTPGSYRVDTETEIRELYDLACRGAESVLFAWTDIRTAMATEEAAALFFELRTVASAERKNEFLTS